LVSQVQPCRRGVGRLLAGATREARAAGKPAPLLLPLAHMGMEELLPRGSMVPRVGQRVSVLVGQPVAVDDLLRRHEQRGCR
jgi:monolysocardiolipin acyltransferase